MRAKTMKAQPGSSSVHVPVPGTEDKKLRVSDAPLDELVPTVDNLDAEVIKGAFNEDCGSDMQEVVSGMDWEMAGNTTDQNIARNLALDNLANDSEYYKKKRLAASKDTLAKSTDADGHLVDFPVGYNLDIGSGAARANGYIGLDLYPHDYGTIVHDVEAGIPFEDESVSKVRMVNSLHEMDNPEGVLSEVSRVLKPGGQLHYEGPDEISQYPDTMEHTSHDTNEDEVEKSGSPVHRQVFTRLATPDAATADDAEPRIGIAEDDFLPADALLAVDASSYAWSDANTSGRGNRIHGYPSQGAMTKSEGLFGEDDDEWDEEDEIEKAELTTDSRNSLGDGAFALPGRRYPIHDLAHARNALARVSQHGSSEEQKKVRAAVYRKYPALKERAMKISKSTGRRVASVAVTHGTHLLMGKRRDNQKWTVPGGHVDPQEDMHAGALRELKEETGIEADKLQEISDVKKLTDKEGKPLDVQCFKLSLNEKPSTSMLDDPDGEVYRWQWVDTSGGLPEHISNNLHVPRERNTMMQSLGMVEKEMPQMPHVIDAGVDNTGAKAGSADRKVRKYAVMKADKHKQIVYGVVLSPDEVDEQDDWMTAEDIEETAHQYMKKSRIVGSNHSKPIDAEPVESYIAPVEFQIDGQYGPQTIKKGAWIVAAKINDPDEWQKILNGDYEAWSIGGFGERA